MAEPEKNQSSPTHSPDPQPPKHDAGKSPHKRKTTSSAAAFPPPSKRPLTGCTPSNKHKIDDITTSKPEKETDDTATSKLKKVDTEVKLPDSMVMKRLVEYHMKNGVYPFDDPNHMKKFCSTFSHFGYGNVDGWNAKFEHLKNRFKNHTAGTVDYVDRAEYELWKTIFGN